MTLRARKNLACFTPPAHRPLFLGKKKMKLSTRDSGLWAFSSFLGIYILELAKKRPYCLLKTERSEQGPVWGVMSSLCGSSLL